ncbi:hypothetical protein IDM40_25905 [Nocardiopsis sp. HNM0947]|uniref:Uncharacterized protein n=1 Tax=Nocardiopsis coralli TaxID=2772213 RepID=A0ABR9PE55_9ACTN|nr:DUF6506 family protein [Nocardiopsis coralli]MBE3002108.1 hypothetical protein [Nocardiopsis coralli]
MSVTWAYLFLHGGTDSVADRTVIDREGQRTMLVPVADPALAPGIAADLVREGATLVELCGGFSLEAAASVRAAVPAEAAVGHMVFTSDSVRAATAFGDAARAG